MSQDTPQERCVKCHNFFDVDNMELIDKVGIVCEECSIKHFCMCDQCGKFFVYEDMYCNDTCINCFEGHQHNTEIIRELNTFPERS